MYGKTIAGILQKNQKKKQEIVKKLEDIFDPETLPEELGDRFSEFAIEYISMDPEELKRRAEITFPDGFVWLKLTGDECRGEGNQMQHCGMAEGDMWSLRDSKGEPHVTIDLDPEQKKILQLRGKQNDQPDPKYCKHVAEFVKHHGVRDVADSRLTGEFYRFLMPDR